MELYLSNHNSCLANALIFIHIIQELCHPKMKIAEGQTPFVFSKAQVWNNLPTHIKEAQSIHTLKNTSFNNIHDDH